MTAGFFLALVAYLSTAIVLHLAFIRYFWLLIGLCAAAAAIAAREVVEDERAADVDVAARPAAA